MHAGHNATMARRGPLRLLVGLLGTAAVGALLYRPDVAWPFDVIDFSEFRPLLESGTSFIGRLGALTAYYAQQGRANVLQYAGTVARWTLFSDWSPGWQVTRLVVMVALIWTSARLFRRLGASSLGAAAGAATFLVAPAAASGWVRLTMAEPLATLIVVTLTLRALDFAKRLRWGREVALLCVGTATVFLLKEMLAPLLILPLAATLLAGEGETLTLRRPRPVVPPDRRYAVLAGAIALVCVAVAIPTLLVFHRAPDAGYVALYGMRWLPPESIGALWASSLLPFRLVPHRASLPWIAAMTAWLSVLVIGWGASMRDPLVRRRSASWLTFAMAWPLLGIVVYAPWPAYPLFYGIPYLTGPALFLALGLTMVQRHAHGRGLAIGLAACIIVLGASDAQEYAARQHAAQRATDDLIGLVSRSARAESVFVATAFPAALAWTGPGPTIARQASATARPWPPTRDVSCSDTSTVPAGVVLIRLSVHCPLARGQLRVVQRYRFIDWSAWRLGVDSITARIEGVPRGA